MIFAFKTILRKHFRFLIDDYAYVETVDPNLTIPEWLERGVVYTNNKFVIVVCDDILEKRFTTIIYKIEADYKIPIFNLERYYTLSEFIKHRAINTDEITDYRNILELKQCIEKSAYYLDIVVSTQQHLNPRF